jgi:Protein of unknown function (DUF3592)
LERSARSYIANISIDIARRIGTIVGIGFALWTQVRQENKMFHFLAESMQAYNQAGLFIGALICLSIGGFVLGNEFYWRVHALRTSGTIIGVLAKDGVYTPVYRYALQGGQTLLAKSDVGSNSVRGKETGRIVPLMISAHNPSEAREANGYFFDIIGVIFFLPGVWLGYTALTAFPVTLMSWIMAVAMLAYLGERGYRILIPKGQRLSIDQWKKLHHTGDTTIDLREVKPIEGITSSGGAQQKQQNQLRNNKHAGPLLGAFAIILLFIGIYESTMIAQLETVGLRAQGQVVRLKSEYSSGSNGGHYTSYPIVRFRTENNVTVEFRDNVGSDPPSYRPGDKVTVLYLPANPQQDVTIDRGIWWNWALPGVVFLAAAFVVSLLITMRRKPTTQNV